MMLAPITPDKKYFLWKFDSITKLNNAFKRFSGDEVQVVWTEVVKQRELVYPDTRLVADRTFFYVLTIVPIGYVKKNYD